MVRFEIDGFGFELELGSWHQDYDSGGHELSPGSSPSPSLGPDCGFPVGLSI